MAYSGSPGSLAKATKTNIRPKTATGTSAVASAYRPQPTTLRSASAAKG